MYSGENMNGEEDYDDDVRQVREALGLLDKEMEEAKSSTSPNEPQQRPLLSALTQGLTTPSSSFTTHTAFSIAAVASGISASFNKAIVQYEAQPKNDNINKSSTSHMTRAQQQFEHVENHSVVSRNSASSTASSPASSHSEVVTPPNIIHSGTPSPILSFTHLPNIQKTTAAAVNNNDHQVVQVHEYHSSGKNYSLLRKLAEGDTSKSFTSSLSQQITTITSSVPDLQRADSQDVIQSLYNDDDFSISSTAKRRADEDEFSIARHPSSDKVFDEDDEGACGSNNRSTAATKKKKGGSGGGRKTSTPIIRQQAARGGGKAATPKKDTKATAGGGGGKESTTGVRRKKSAATIDRNSSIPAAAFAAAASVFSSAAQQINTTTSSEFSIGSTQQAQPTASTIDQADDIMAGMEALVKVS